jgi:hypothetical protein
VRDWVWCRNRMRRVYWGPEQEELKASQAQAGERELLRMARAAVRVKV